MLETSCSLPLRGRCSSDLRYYPVWSKAVDFWLKSGSVRVDNTLANIDKLHFTSFWGCEGGALAKKKMDFLNIHRQILSKLWTIDPHTVGFVSMRRGEISTINRSHTDILQACPTNSTDAANFTGDPCMRTSTLTVWETEWALVRITALCPGTRHGTALS